MFGGPLPQERANRWRLHALPILIAAGLAILLPFRLVFLTRGGAQNGEAAIDAGSVVTPAWRRSTTSDASRRLPWRLRPMNAQKKVFARSADQIQPLAEGYGACFASDEITVKGRRVGYAYRDAPDNENDSGWRFTAGDESDAYMNDPDHLAAYDVNTIANYDRDIIPLLESGVGATFARDGEAGKFVQLEQGKDEFPLVEGSSALTRSWTIELPPGRYKRRIEDGSFVLWRRGLTAWIGVSDRDPDEPAARRLAGIRAHASSERFDSREEQTGGLLLFSYRLKEDKPAASFYGFAVGRSTYVQIGVYFDQESDAAIARAMLQGLRER
jgi:hypothetical protein